MEDDAASRTGREGVAGREPDAARIHHGALRSVDEGSVGTMRLPCGRRGWPDSRGAAEGSRPQLPVGADAKGGHAQARKPGVEGAPRGGPRVIFVGAEGCSPREEAPSGGVQDLTWEPVPAIRRPEDAADVLIRAQRGGGPERGRGKR